MAAHWPSALHEQSPSTATCHWRPAAPRSELMNPKHVISRLLLLLLPLPQPSRTHPRVSRQCAEGHSSYRLSIRRSRNHQPLSPRRSRTCLQHPLLCCPPLLHRAASPTTHQSRVPNQIITPNALTRKLRPCSHWPLSRTKHREPPTTTLSRHHSRASLRRRSPPRSLRPSITGMHSLPPRIRQACLIASRRLTSTTTATVVTMSMMLMLLASERKPWSWQQVSTPPRW